MLAPGQGAEQVVLLQRVGLVVVERGGLLAIEEEHQVGVDILVDTVAVVYGPLRAVVQQVFAEGYVGVAVAQGGEYGGHDVDLLCHTALDAARQLTRRVEDEYWRREEPERGAVLVMGGLVGVVGSEHKDGVAEPRLPGRGLEETAQGIVGVADALVHWQGAEWEAALVGLGDDEGVVRRGGEDGRHEGLRHVAHGQCIVLQERLVPDGPGAVEVGIAVEAWVGRVLGAAIVVGKACAAGEGLEAHGTVLGTVEEGCGVALGAKGAGHAAHLVERGGGEEEGLYEHGYRREDGGHAVDALAAVGEGVFPCEGVGQERVDKGGEAAVGAGIQVAVVEAYVFAAEALDYEHHHVLGLQRSAAVGGVERGVEAVHGVVVHVVRVGEGLFAGGAYHRERRVEHDGGLGGSVHILVGIADGDGADGGGEASAHGTNRERYQEGQNGGLHDVVAPARALYRATGFHIEPKQYQEQGDAE